MRADPVLGGMWKEYPRFENELKKTSITKLQIVRKAFCCSVEKGVKAVRKPIKSYWRTWLQYEI